MIAKFSSRFCLLTVVLLLACESRNSAAQDSAPDWKNEQGGRSFRSDRINVPRWRLTNGPHVRSAFREVVEQAREATVRVRGEGRDVALGAIVDAEGWVLTKASALPEKVSCRLADAREFDAEIVDIDRAYDMALLKIEGFRLPALKLEEIDEPKIGAWLATVGLKRGPLAVGVMSVETRKIQHWAGTLGVRLSDLSSPATIVEVFPSTGAAEAGLQADDVVLSIDGEATPTRESFVRLVRKHSPGDEIVLSVRRDGKTLSIEAMLREKRPWRMQTREEFQNQLGSLLSKRRFGFPQAFQHDTVVKPSDCGGPVLNLDGEVVGLNIARAGRTETFAIPVAQVISLLEEMIPGPVGEPAVVGAAP